MAAGKSIISGTFIHCLLMDVYGCNKNISLQIETLQKQRSMAAQRAEASILFQPRKLPAGRADPFVPGGRLTAYRLALTVKGSGYGPGSRTLSPACSTPGATTPGVVPPTPLGLPSRLPKNRRILVQSASKAGDQIRPAGVVQMCPPATDATNRSNLVPWSKGERTRVSG